MVSEDHPQIALVRRFYAAWSQRDAAAARACFAPDAVWHVPGRSPIAGAHRGWDAIRTDFLDKLRELSGDTFRAELTDVLSSERHVLALQHATGTRGQRRLDITACQLMTIHNGQIVEVRSHYSDQYGLDDFWS